MAQRARGRLLSGRGRRPAAGVRVLGYADTDYGRRAAADVVRDLTRHRDRYGTDGAFLDRVPSGPEELSSSSASPRRAARSRPGGPGPGAGRGGAPRGAGAGDHPWGTLPYTLHNPENTP